jgi:rhodanese-related sulfurtransferase
MVKAISAGEAAQLVGDNSAVLLDVREPDEWQAVRAPGALHIPMGQLATSLDRLRQDQTIACICHVGVRSAAVADALANAGYDAVNVSGGMNAWESAGLPVERG